MADWSLDFDAPQYLWLTGAVAAVLAGEPAIAPRAGKVAAAGGPRAADARRHAVGPGISGAQLAPACPPPPVLFVVDGSSSINQSQLQDALTYVKKRPPRSARRRPRRLRRGGGVRPRCRNRDPAARRPWRLSRIESVVDPRFTNLAVRWRWPKPPFRSTRPSAW